MFKLSAETKFNIQHFEIFFLFFPENKNLFFGGQYFRSNCLLKQNSTYNILKYFSYFSQKTKTCFLGDNINLSSPAELAQRVKKVKVH